jgi:hypothetical protein
MLKVAGWIVSISAVDDWRRAHPELRQRHTGLATKTNAVGILGERIHKGLKPLPVSEEDFICTSWPKVGTLSFSDLSSNVQQRLLSR